MREPADIIEIGKPVTFTIDGRTYDTVARWQPAANLLVLAGLDPTVCKLGELRRDRVRLVRYEGNDIVGIRRWARFVSLRDRAAHIGKAWSNT